MVAKRRVWRACPPSDWRRRIRAAEVVVEIAPSGKIGRRANVSSSRCSD
jgi:hypothetical protein